MNRQNKKVYSQQEYNDTAILCIEKILENFCFNRVDLADVWNPHVPLQHWNAEKWYI